MNKVNIGFYSALIVIGSVFLLLYSGSSVLTVGLDKKDTIPLGTFITAAGIVSVPLAIILGVSKLRNPEGAFYTFLAKALKIMLFCALMWIPVSYFLSGNLSFNFTGKDTFRGGQLGMKWFWYYSYTIVTIPIVIWLTHCILSLFQWIKKND